MNNQTALPVAHEPGRQVAQPATTRMRVEQIEQHLHLGATSRIGALEVLSLAFKHRRKLLTAFLIPPVLAILALLLLDPKYRAQSEIMVKTGREYLPQAEGDASMSAPTSTKQEEINSEIDLITSRPVVEATINKIGLKNLYPDIAPGRFSGATAMDNAVDQFTHSIDVEPVKMSNIIAVQYDDDSPQRATMVLDTLIATYIAKHTEVFAGNHAVTYQDAIQRSLDEIQRLEKQRTGIKLDNHIYDIAAQRTALITQRVEAQSHLDDSINNQQNLRKRVAYLASARGRVPKMMRSTSTDAAAEATHAQVSLTDLQQQEASLSAIYAPDYPELKRVRDQIGALKTGMAAMRADKTATSLAPSQLAQQVDQELVMDNAELAPLDGEIARFTTTLAGINTELHRLEQADLELRTIGGRIDAVNDNLRALQARYDQARTQDELDREKLVSVVQIAKSMASGRPASPKKPVFLVGGVLLGLLAAGSVVILALLTNKTVVTEGEIERLLRLPVLATVPVRISH